MDAPNDPGLILEFQAENLCVALPRAAAQTGQRLTLGADAENDLVFPGAHTSRQHAFIEVHRDDFFLVDCSTNGTYVQTEDRQVQHVHRARLRLWGAGWIGLGQPLTPEGAILFREAI